jgi:hypothetical protein
VKRDKPIIQIDALEQIKKLNVWEQGRAFTQCELIGITGNTINALLRKGIIEIVEGTPFEEYDLHYYRWTGKELE